ncbi:tRNA (adenine(58)-N(1))-methyltransferase catalytic subunit TRMT61A [Brachionus plicatilis]|uniref:tRNA (adenine(58)-N(1))-methyltransferase catalytic subunit TRMT61A n=1 Tax=Brachionus plicatilis TaxID=10195 RepID=A0A3M7PB91_BRAPC|nr:tRNA (adenine(58)-N(1))-methyltransferase catalytic subunit TRMT61A [Brachionus plicatilis]
MSFCRTNKTIKEGDTVILYLSFNQLYPIQVKRGLSHHTKYGSLKHSDLIGKKFGSRVECSQGSLFVLQGSPEMWTISLPHRTQIIYTPNISVITMQLDLKPGSIVIESGTGSASLSHALIRTVYPTGHLHTFEFHQQRSEAASKEFKDHEVSDYVSVYHRDVCAQGFGVEDLADAVFLDLPSPWKALESAKRALKKEGGRICSFSPCIEQVQKTSLELSKLGFVNVFTVESLRRILSVKKYDLPDFDFNMDWKIGKDEEEKCSNDKNNIQKPAVKRTKNATNDSEESDEEIDESTSTRYTAKPINIQPGHTGFLTFATLLHKNF